MTRSRAITENAPVMRRQTACNLTVRLTWEPADNHEHPRYTFGCVEDEDMARTMAAFAAAGAPELRRLVAVEVSPSAGRYDPWTPIDLFAVPEWLRPAPA